MMTATANELASFKAHSEDMARRLEEAPAIERERIAALIEENAEVFAAAKDSVSAVKLVAFMIRLKP